MVAFADFGCEMPIWLLEDHFEGLKAPSSTTQSLRSMSDVFRPRLGGDGDGDGLVAGWREPEVIVDGGDSRKSIGSAFVVRDSNADILDLTDILVLEQGQMATTDLYAVAGNIILE